MRKLALPGLLFGFLLIVAGGLFWALQLPVIQIVQFSDDYGRRTEDLSANITGKHHLLTKTVNWRLNNGSTQPVRQGWPRAPWPDFVIEIPPDQLSPGENKLEIEAADWLGRSQRIEHSFVYNPDTLTLPTQIDWSQQNLDVQDGFWETIERDGEYFVRPRPGYEFYDRIALATGAFPINRRIETDVVFRHDVLEQQDRGAREYGFGILSLWGGHPGSEELTPRRGWKFSLAWYWSKPDGVGNEMSVRIGETEPGWVGSYRSIRLRPDIKYKMIIEVRKLADTDGQEYIEQRLKWWPENDPQPATWLITEDREGNFSLNGEYAVGLLAFNCQVEFAGLTIIPI